MALFSKKQLDAPRRRLRANKLARHVTEQSLEQRSAFRRNRTLTGSVSSQIVSTNESNAQLKSVRVQTHELAATRRHIGGILLLVLMGCLMLYGLISQFTAGVVVKSHKALLKLDPGYEQIMQSYFASRPVERLRFLIDANHFNEYVQLRAPEVASVKVEGSAGFGVSAFTVAMREPIAGWSIHQQQQYVDASGTAFERNYFASPTVQIIDNSGAQVQAGQAVASNRFLGFVGRAVGLAKNQGYTVLEVVIPAGTTREVELRLEGVSFPVRFSVDRPAGQQTEDMARVLRWLQSHAITPQYLDVRVSGKAFYK